MTLDRCCSSKATDTDHPQCKTEMTDEKKNVFQTRVELFDNWVAKQCLPVEAAINTVTGALSGAFIGVLADVFFDGVCSALSIRSPPKGCKLNPDILARFGGYHPLIQTILAGTRLEQARSFAVMFGVSSGISCVMEKIRGKDDVQTCMVAAFGSGVMISLVSGMRGPEVMSVGALFALLFAGNFQIQEKLSQPKAGNVLHDKRRDMFSSIGLGVDQYAMNYNTGLFTNNALLLRSDRQILNMVFFFNILQISRTTGLFLLFLCL